MWLLSSCHATQSSMSERLTFRLSLLPIFQFICNTLLKIEKKNKFRRLNSARVQFYLHKQLSQLTTARNEIVNRDI